MRSIFVRVEPTVRLVADARTIALLILLGVALDVWSIASRRDDVVPFVRAPIFALSFSAAPICDAEHGE